MLIRKAIPEDLETLVTLFEAYRQFYRKQANLQEATNFIGQRLKNEDSILFLAEAINKEIVGFTQLYPSFSSTRMQRLWILNDLYILPDFRGKGISKLLIAETKKHCIKTKACGILLETEKDNLIGNKLYPAEGFSLEENNFYFWTNNNDD